MSWCFVGNQAEFVRGEQLAGLFAGVKAHGYDGVCIKRSEGTIRWYDSLETVAAEAALAAAHGLEYMPFTYSYGPRFGDGQIDGEAAIIRDLLQTCGRAMLDMEVEWDGQIGAAERLQADLADAPGYLYCTTWWNPAPHNWISLLDALHRVDCWVPQCYGIGARAEWEAQGAPHVRTWYPAVTALTEAECAGYPTEFFWEYANLPARAPASPPPPPAPMAVAAPAGTYTVQPGDDLSSIAAQRGYPWPVLYHANAATIDATARAHGYDGPEPWNLVYAGEVLVLP